MRSIPKGYTISFVVSVLLIVNLILPVVQVILLYCNGSFIALIEDVVGDNIKNLEITVNLILSLAALFGYYRFNSLITKLLFTSLTIFFANGLIVFAFWIILGNEETSYHPWQFVSAAIFTSLGLISMDFLRSKNKILEK